jgi:hypothetical protein
MNCEMESELGFDWRDNSGYSDVERFSDGTYKSFVPEIDTEWMLSRRTLILAAGHRVRFFANGQLESCVLAARATIDVFGAPVVLAADTALTFHASGGVRSFTLGSQASWLPWASRVWKYRGSAYDEGTKLLLSEDGAVAAA